MSDDDKMVFKTEEEKAQALIDLPSEPEDRVNDLDAWHAEIEEKRKKIEEATVEDNSAEEASQESSEEPTEPSPDEELNFTFKRSELPDELKGYKSSDEIIKQYAHARKYANQVEEKLDQFETLNSEHKSLKEQFEALQEKLKEKEEAAPIAPPPPSSDAMDELEKSILKLEAMDENDYLTAKQSKDLFSGITGRVKTALKELNDTKESLRKDIESTKSEFGQFKTSVETSTKEQTLERQSRELVKSLNKLQENNPELKLSKPVIGNDSVQTDMGKFAKKVLGGLYSNYNPEWNHVTAFMNAYLKDDPTIKKYCEDNAITPESLGSSKEDMQKYAIILNVHNRVQGKKVRPDGNLEELKNPFTGKPVSYQNHNEAYQALKTESGLAEKEIQEMIAEAEKRAQKNMSAAMNKRATDAIDLGGAGETSPDDIGKDMTEAEARKFFKDNPDLEFEMNQQALMGDRTLFNKANRCLKRIMGDKYDPFEVDPAWPPENKNG